MKKNVWSKFSLVGLTLLLVGSFVLAACGDAGNGASQSAAPGQNAGTGTPAKDNGGVKVSTDPVTLKVLVIIGLADQDFDQYIAAPTKKLYPNITLEKVTLPKGKTLGDLVTTGDVPDIILQGANITDLFDLKLPLDLTPLIKQTNIDLNRFDPSVIDTIKQYGDKNHFYAMPFRANEQVLFYNKGIFDNFGVAYPKDGLFWEDAIELARKLTKSEGGVNYRGLDPLPSGITGFASPLSLQMYDEKTGKALISDQWKTVFDTAMAAYNIPGNKPEAVKTYGARDPFLKDKNLAMTNDFINYMFAQFINDGNIIDWDLAQLPSFKTAPNKTNQTDFHQFFITSSSKHPVEAMEVVKAATSDEVQLALAKSGSLPVLKNAEIQKQFGVDLPFKNKHMEGLFKSQTVKKQDSEYDSFVSKAITSAFNDVFSGNADVNTALRQAEEQANKDIAQAKQSK